MKPWVGKWMVRLRFKLYNVDACNAVHDKFEGTTHKGF